MEIEKEVSAIPEIHVKDDAITENGVEDAENGVEDAETSGESEDDEEEDERYCLQVEQKEKLNLKKDTYKAMRDVFRTLDADGSGSLEVSELETAMKSMGVECSDKDMENLIKQMDADGNGTVDFFEFCEMVSEKMKVYNPEKELREAFAVFDINGDGKVSVDEIQSVVESFGGKMTKEEIDNMFIEADENSDGYIDYGEFVKIWMGETSTELDKKVGSMATAEDDKAEIKDNEKLDQLTVPK